MRLSDSKFWGAGGGTEGAEDQAENGFHSLCLENSDNNSVKGAGQYRQEGSGQSRESPPYSGHIRREKDQFRPILELLAAIRLAGASDR